LRKKNATARQSEGRLRGKGICAIRKVLRHRKKPPHTPPHPPPPPTQKPPTPPPPPPTPPQGGKVSLVGKPTNQNKTSNLPTAREIEGRRTTNGRNTKAIRFSSARGRQKSIDDRSVASHKKEPPRSFLYEKGGSRKRPMSAVWGRVLLAKDTKGGKKKIFFEENLSRKRDTRKKSNSFLVGGLVFI